MGRPRSSEYYLFRAMAKRYGNDFDSSNSSSAKRSKISSPVNGPAVRENSNCTNNNDDVWGEDFDDDAIEELDFIASQACSQNVHTSIEAEIGSRVPIPGRQDRFDAQEPSTSRAPYRAASNLRNFEQSPRPSQNNAGAFKINGRIQSQRIASSENLKEIMDEPHMGFADFKTNLLGRQHLNSTFRSNNDVVIVPDETSLKHLEKLEQENKKLLDDFMTKEGETAFLRSQLQQTQLRAENEKIEKARFIEEQASRHRMELNNLHKEKENLKTENEFQALQLGTLMERCKLLESGAIKLTQPQKSIAFNDSPNRSKFGSPNRAKPAVKQAKTSETSVQTSDLPKPSSNLKTYLRVHPLESIPKSIFESSLQEKSVVDIQIVEKIGKKNLPILQEEDTFRIFENPVLVKPIVTLVHEKQLNVEFFLPDVAVIMKKTSEEINSEECVPIVNKIVSSARELLLNSTIVLKTIKSAMRNDDMRDMNDVYLSDFYDMTIDSNRSICDANVWYERERGIEARRAMGVLSYIAKTSNYLGEYIAGKSKLFVEQDMQYSQYNEQMIRYSAWEKKDHEFEILEMILEFVTVLGLVRRSHQFSGLICAIARTLKCVQNRVGFCPKGLEYVGKIFKELVFSRPLLCCFVSMTKMISVLCKSASFAQRLCSYRRNVTSVVLWQSVLHFTPDACPLEIYIAQVERFRFDPVTTIDMSDALLTFVHLIILKKSIPWTSDSPNACPCCTRVVTYSIKLLCNCSKINLRKIKRDTELNDEKLSTRLGEDYWQRVNKKQMNVLRNGIIFLSYLAKQDPDFVIRISDIEDSFYLFMQRIADFDGLTLHKYEQEALTLIKSSLTFERHAAMEPRAQQSKQVSSIKSAFESKPTPTPASGQWFDCTATAKRSSQQAIDMYEEVLSGRRPRSQAQ